MTTFNVVMFNGDSSDSNQIYRSDWRPLLLAELSTHCFPIHSHGLLGFALQPEEYGGYEADVFVPKVMPDPAPALNASTNAWSVYNSDVQRFEKQQVAIALATRSILSSLGPAPLELLRDPATNRISNNLRNILLLLDASYLPVSRAELRDALNGLNENFDDSKDFKSFATKHLKIHRTCAQANQPISELTKIDHLMKAVEHQPSLTFCGEQYLSSSPVERQTFAGLSTALANHINNRTSSRTTTAHFANASIKSFSSETSIDLLSNSVTQMTKQLTMLQAKLEHMESARGMSPHTSSSGNFNTRRNSNYCWTHGSNGHPGTKCRNPAPGHIKDATLEKKRGGKE